MRPVLKFFALAAAGIMLTQTLSAVPITGALTISGTASLDGTTVDTSTTVESWGALNPVSGAFGSFAGVNGLSANLAAPWTFYSGTIYDFWNVGGFQFNLSSSAVFADYAGVLTVILDGTVTGNSYDPTAFVARLKINDPAVSGGDFNYTESLDYVATPDGGPTVFLLGLTLAGLALLRRRQPTV